MRAFSAAFFRENDTENGHKEELKKIRHGFRALGMIVCLAVWMYSAGSVYRYL